MSPQRAAQAAHRLKQARKFENHISKMSEVDIDNLMMPPPPSTTRKRPRSPSQEQVSNKGQDVCEVSGDDSVIAVQTSDEDNEQDDQIFETKEEESSKAQTDSVGESNPSINQVTSSTTTPDVRIAKSPNVRFSDIIGHSAAKLRLDEALLPLALPPSLARSVLTGVRAAPASILLHGPPGCGKTQLARAVAGEAQAAFISIGPSDILSKFVGESEAAVREVFQEGE